MVLKAEDYPWSSAAAYCGLKEDQLLNQRLAWKMQRQQIIDWSSWLVEEDELQTLEVLRRNVEKGLPCGTEKFVRRLENEQWGHPLAYRCQ